MCFMFSVKKVKAPFRWKEPPWTTIFIFLFLFFCFLFFSVFEFNCSLIISGDSTYCNNNLLESWHLHISKNIRWKISTFFFISAIDFNNTTWSFIAFGVQNSIMHYFTVHDISNFVDDFCFTADHFLSHCYQVLRSCYFALCLFSCGVDYLLCFAYFQDDFNDALQYDFWISKGLGDKLYTEHYPHLKYRVQLEQFPLQASWISFFIFSLPIYNSLFLSCRLAENVSLEYL